MTAPTQELPSWMSYSTSLATNAAGEPTATFTTIVNLPLTYYGPSIPLGPDDVWVYGGLSSPQPASSSLPSVSQTSVSSVVSLSTSTFATPTAISALPPSTSPISSFSRTPTTSSIPPITSPLSLASTLPTTLTATPSLFPPSVSTVSTSSTSSTIAPINAGSSSSNRAGVIVGAILGSVVGSLLLLFGIIFFTRTRQQRPRTHRPDPPTSQVLWMWQDVHEGDDDQDADLDAQLRSPGHASAQSSGDEREAFLRRSGDVVNGAKDVAPTARLVDAPRTSHDSSGPIGVALVTSSKASIASPEQRHIISPEHFAEKPSGSRPSADFIKSLEDPDLGPDEPLLPPPPVNLNISHGSRKSLMPSERSMTPGNDPESALLYTAQRVQVGRSTQSRSSSGTPWASGIGIPSILRRSWLNPKTRSATPTNSSPKSSLIGRQLTDTELEAGRSLSAQLPSEMGYRDASARPLSGVSAMSTGSGRSGNTVFYDAQSREESSPTPPSGPPNPQSTSSNSRSGPSGPSPLSAEPLRASDGEEPPAYEANPSDSRKTDDVVDYLDVPIPRPASPFASVSSVKRLPAPPGLGPPASNLAAASQPDVDDLINIEVLEEPPPAAGENWRQIAQGLPGLDERRTTFGFVPSTVYPHEQTVTEQGSLRSMRSHVSPHSVLSASGSAPTSNSASAHSRGFTVNSLKSLAHSSSISSTDRRIVRPNPGEVSPPLSATGRRPAVPPPSHELGKPSPEAFAGAPELAQSTTVTSTATRSSVTTHTSMTDPITGEVVRFSHPSWTGGRDSLEEPDSRQPPSGAWGGSWSSPNHLRVLQNRVAGRENASHA